MSFSKLPSVLSFKRSVVITDAIMNNIYADGSEDSVQVVRHGIRGTQNIVNDTKNEVSNIQETDTAKTDVKSVGMSVKFDICFLPISTSIDSCVLPEFTQSVERFCARTMESDGIKEVSLRFARNIANGRWLWRNRSLAKSIKVIANVEDKEIEFDSLSIPLKIFDNYSEQEKQLAKHIESSLSVDSVNISVVAEIDFYTKGAIEVYPSQNYIAGEKEKGFSRSLYKFNTNVKRSKNDSSVVGYAAIRDQKIGNAIRTIDTWYPDFDNHGVPIPVEPNGANLDAQEFFRRNNGQSSFDFFRKLDDIDVNTNEGMFCIANLIRGGVYSESDKAKTK